MALKSISLQVIFALVLVIFGSECHMAPASAGGTFKQFDIGTFSAYKLTTVVLLNEAGGRGKDVGYQITCDVHVKVVWVDVQDKNSKLLQFEIQEPQLHIKSRKAPAPEGFVGHSSQLNDIKSRPFLAHWVNGRIENVYVDSEKEISINNFKEGVASLFQFQLLDTKTSETDTSGSCQVTYQTVNPQKFTKTKTDCISEDTTPFIKHTEHVLSTAVSSNRSAVYLLSKDLSMLESVSSEETHELSVNLKHDAGGSVTATQQLVLTDSKETATPLHSKQLKEAIKEFEDNNKLTLIKTTLQTKVDKTECDKDECSLPKLIKENREFLTSDHLGSVKSASLFIKLLNIARDASKEELTKAFKGTKNKEILPQLCDLAGAIQTLESHKVIMKLINMDSDEYQDQTERYLWALSQGSHPDEEVIRDILKISSREHTNDKISETLLLTVAAMINKFQKQPQKANHKLVNEVVDVLLNSLESCKDEQCKYKHLRALKNLKHPKTIPALINNALNGKRRVSVLAMVALQAIDRKYWDSTVQDLAQRIYYQVNRKYDSSSRAIAIDIMLESNMQVEAVEELVLSLTERDAVYEVKQYLYQRIKQISDENLKFNELVNNVYTQHNNSFNNYDVKSLRGLTTAFTRVFANSTRSRGSIVSIQEISNGLLKRGTVDVVLETDGQVFSVFTLGLFAGGLNSFVSSNTDDQVDTNEVEESATAGMEVTVGGVQIRPFVFFNGQGELMGHVWSGTASEKTPAFHAFVLLQDHLEYIPLQNGIMTKLYVTGVASFDLSAQIQMSIWNRNAHTLVEKNAGVAVQGKIQADTAFVRSQVEFNVGTEGKLHIVSDINFYNDVSICMQVSQPDTIVKHNIHKIERIPGSKHRLRKSKYKSLYVPGRTYLLNRKNNEMCNKVFKDT